MDTIKEGNIFKKDSTARTRKETFGILIVSKNAPAIALNEDAKIVWDLIDGTNTVGDIISNVVKEYDKSEDVKIKVIETIKGLVKANLIKC